jgi:hypothetical protein
MAQRFTAKLVLPADDALLKLWPDLQRTEGASLARMEFLLQDVPGCRIFLVNRPGANKNNPDEPHLVAALPCGSFACSCGDVAAMGAPDRHVYAVVKAGWPRLCRSSTSTRPISGL